MLKFEPVDRPELPAYEVSRPDLYRVDVISVDGETQMSLHGYPNLAAALRCVAGLMEKVPNLSQVAWEISAED